MVALTCRRARKPTEAAGALHFRSARWRSGVVEGQAKPLTRPSPILCPEIHGDSGLDAPGGEERLPRSTQRALPGKAVNVMFEGIAAWWRAAQQQQQATSQGSGAPRVK